MKHTKVFLCSDSNNVSPRFFSEWECPSLTKILQEQGKDALDLELMRCYESGSFQRGSIKYVRALKVLRHMPEYRTFNWRVNGLGEEYDKVCLARQTPAFDKLLTKALKTQLPKDKFIIRKPWCSSIVYLHRASWKTARWFADKTRATIFRYRKEAEDYIKGFSYTSDWEIVQRD